MFQFFLFVGEMLMNEEPEKVAREQPKCMARIQSAYKSFIKEPGELNLPTISVEFDNSMSSLIPKHGELLEGENGLGKKGRELCFILRSNIEVLEICC